VDFDGEELRCTSYKAPYLLEGGFFSLSERMRVLAFQVELSVGTAKLVIGHCGLQPEVPIEFIPDEAARKLQAFPH